MKQVFTLISFLLFSSTLFAQDVFIQKPVLSKITADWCPFCGQYGWDFMERSLDELNQNATIISVHHSGELKTTESDELADNFNSVGQPKFYLNNTELGVQNANADAKFEALKTSINELNNEAPEWGINIQAFRSGDNITGSIDLYALAELNGDFYVSAFYLGNNIIHPQAGNEEDASHKKIIKGNFFDTTFGEQINVGTISEGEIYNFELNKLFEPIGGTQDIAVIVWRKEGNQYLVSNSNVLEEISVFSSNENVFSQLEGIATLQNNAINIELSSKENIGDYTVSLIGLDGKVAMQNNNTANKTIIESMDVSNVTSGTYIVHIMTKKTAWNQKVIITK